MKSEDYLKRYEDKAVAYICMNGHVLSTDIIADRVQDIKYCRDCGEKLITNCQKCNANIKGKAHYDYDFLTPPFRKPSNCPECGNPFPWTEKKLLLKENENNSIKDNIKLLNAVFERIHLIIKQLRQRYDDRDTINVKDEYDLQDLVHALLIIYFDDIRKEEWNPSYAGSSTRSDFLLKQEQIVIEIKHTRKGLNARKLGEELIIDKEKYKAHPDCKKLYCLVYDPEGYINNPKAIEEDLKEETETFSVKVLIVPKGY